MRRRKAFSGSQLAFWTPAKVRLAEARRIDDHEPDDGNDREDRNWLVRRSPR
jgi:hypothetical protein